MNYQKFCDDFMMELSKVGHKYFMHINDSKDSKERLELINIYLSCTLNLCAKNIAIIIKSSILNNSDELSFKNDLLNIFNISLNELIDDLLQDSI